jgi:inositol phosphorylceramide mannosyltransferase catalytic subunit
MDSKSRFFPNPKSRKRLLLIGGVAAILYFFFFSSLVSIPGFSSGYISSSSKSGSKPTKQSHHASHIPSGGRKARYLSPAELMKRPLARAQASVPKLIHQSWSNTELPKRFKQWSDGCREQHPDWEWVLWTDDDNNELVKTFLPWLVPAFEKLKGPIYKADLVRNAYMLLFGG